MTVEPLLLLLQENSGVDEPTMSCYLFLYIGKGTVPARATLSVAWTQTCF